MFRHYYLNGSQISIDVIQQDTRLTFSLLAYPILPYYSNTIQYSTGARVVLWLLIL